MDAFSRELNILLVDTFRSILKMEERMLKDGSGIDLSIHEMHVLEAVGQGSRPRTISDIARDLDITLPSATIAINKLARKGYVEKSRGTSDKRQVLVTLTRTESRSLGLAEGGAVTVRLAEGAPTRGGGSPAPAGVVSVR